MVGLVRPREIGNFFNEKMIATETSCETPAILNTPMQLTFLYIYINKLEKTTLYAFSKCDIIISFLIFVTKNE